MECRLYLYFKFIGSDDSLARRSTPATQAAHHKRSTHHKSTPRTRSLVGAAHHKHTEPAFFLPLSPPRGVSVPTMMTYSLLYDYKFYSCDKNFILAPIIFRALIFSRGSAAAAATGYSFCHILSYTHREYTLLFIYSMYCTTVYRV